LRYNSGPTSRKSLLTAFLLIAIFAGFALRFVDLGGKSLWADEMHTIRQALVNKEMGTKDIFENLQGPLVSVMMHFWAAVSTAESFLRFPFALAGTLSVGAIFLLSKLLSGRWVALNTAFFASLSPILIWYSQKIGGYAFVVLFSMLMTYYLVLWAASRKKLHLFLYGVFLLAGLLSNLSAAFVPVAHFIYLVAIPSKRRLVGAWLVTVLVVLLFFSPWVRNILPTTNADKVVGGETGRGITAGGDFWMPAIPYFFFTYGVGYSLGPPGEAMEQSGIGTVTDRLPWVLFPLVVFAVPAAAGIRRLAGENSELLFLLLLWLGIPILGVYALEQWNVGASGPGYALVSLVPYTLIVGRGLGAITRSRWWFLTIVCAGLMGVSLWNYFVNPAYGNGSPAAARTIGENFMEGGTVVGLSEAEPLIQDLKDLAEVETSEGSGVQSRDNVAARRPGIVESPERVWLSLCRESPAGPEGLVKRRFDNNTVPIRSLGFARTSVLPYEKGDG